MFDDYPIVTIDKTPVNRNELIMMVGEIKWRVMKNSSLIFGRTCDVAIADINFFGHIDTREQYCDIHNFWGVGFSGEVRGLFIASPKGYAAIVLDKRPVGEIETFFDFGLQLIKAIGLLEDYTTDESELSDVVSTIECDGFESHAYSLITKDGDESIRRRDLQLLSWSFPHLFTTINKPLSARQALFSYGEEVIKKLNPTNEKRGAGIHGKDVTYDTISQLKACKKA